MHWVKPRDFHWQRVKQRPTARRSVRLKPMVILMVTQKQMG